MSLEFTGPLFVNVVPDVDAGEARPDRASYASQHVRLSALDGLNVATLQCMTTHVSENATVSGMCTTKTTVDRDTSHFRFYKVYKIHEA